jgi:hypothetical protein
MEHRREPDRRHRLLRRRRARVDGRDELEAIKHGYEDNRKILIEGLPKAGLDKFLPVDGAVLKKMVAMGYRPTQMTKSRFPEIGEEITTLDFSGWPMIVRADMPNEIAYAICEAIEQRKEAIPTDNYKPLEIAQLCANDEEAPYDVPLHKGAERFYRDRDYLR